MIEEWMQWIINNWKERLDDWKERRIDVMNVMNVMNECNKRLKRLNEWNELPLEICVTFEASLWPTMSASDLASTELIFENNFQNFSKRGDPLDHWFFNRRDPLSTVFENTRALRQLFFEIIRNPSQLFFDMKDPPTSALSITRTTRQLLFQNEGPLDNCFLKNKAPF